MTTERHFTSEQARRQSDRALKGDAKAQATLRRWRERYPAEVETAMQRSGLLRTALAAIEAEGAKHERQTADDGPA